MDLERMIEGMERLRGAPAEHTGLRAAFLANSRGDDRACE